MKRAVTIVGMLLLAFAVSCRKADTHRETAGDAAARDKIIKAQRLRAQSLKECDALLAEARKANSDDFGTALAAWEKAAGGLQRNKQHIDPARWLSMQSEVNKARETLLKMKVLRDIMDVVDNARQSGDKDRLMETLETATTKPGVPPKLVESWAAEINRIQEDMAFDKIKKLVVNQDAKGALEALDVFIRKYPGNIYAKRLKEGLEKREARILARKEAFDLFDREKWAEAPEKLKILRVQYRGDREIKEKMVHCQYMLEMVKFEAAIKAGNYKAAEAAGEKARVFKPDAWDTEIEPKLAAMKARQ